MKLHGLPARINRIVAVPSIIRQPLYLVSYFTSVRLTAEFDEGDGTVLGHLLFLQLHKHRKNKGLLSDKIMGMIGMINVLRSAQAKYR